VSVISSFRFGIRGLCNGCDSFNDAHAISQSNLQFRSANDVSAGGLYLSTFFGGSDGSWAPRVDAHTYFRNFRLWGGSAPSNLTGAHVSAAMFAHRAPRATWVVGIACLSVVLGIAGIWARSWRGQIILYGLFFGNSIQSWTVDIAIWFLLIIHLASCGLGVVYYRYISGRGYLALFCTSAPKPDLSFRQQYRITPGIVQWDDTRWIKERDTMEAGFWSCTVTLIW